MSGGHLVDCDYSYFRLVEFAEAIEKIVKDNHCEEINEWGEKIGSFYSEAVIERLTFTAKLVRAASNALKHCDWLVSGDTSDDSFLRDWNDDIVLSKWLCIKTAHTMNKDGYGIVNIGKKKVGDHRIAYCKANNLSLKDIFGKVVRHTCDNPWCINPHHLVLGTQTDNMKDMDLRNRRARGTKFPQSRLNEELVKDIRKRFLTETYKEIAKSLGISYSTIRVACIGETWKHVPMLAKDEIRKGGFYKLNEKDVLKIRERARTETQKVIAKDYGVGETAINDIIRGKSWKNVPIDQNEVVRNRRVKK